MSAAPLTNRISGYYPTPVASANTAQSQNPNAIKGLIAVNQQMEQRIKQMEADTAQMFFAIAKHQEQKEQPKGTISKVFSGIKKALGPAILAGVSMAGAFALVYTGTGQSLKQLGQEVMGMITQRSLGAAPMLYQLGRATMESGIQKTAANVFHYAAQALAVISGLNFIQGYVNPNK